MQFSYSIMGYTCTDVEQVRTVLLVAKLQDRQNVVDQCMSIIKRFENRPKTEYENSVIEKRGRP